MTSLTFDSAIQLAARIKRREISSEELTQHYIDRIERHDSQINAVVVRDFEQALERARLADEVLSSGEYVGPLHGVPMTVKEIFDVTGLPSSWGDPELKHNIATSDDPTISRLRAAGAIILGKTNTPLRAMDLQTFNEVYGTTNNPWDSARTPGGSSGGSAASLAAGFAGLELGSDIGGSIRNPASHCGVYGHKPTYNIVPTFASTPPETWAVSDLAVAGPLARSAEDLGLALDLLGGANELNASGWRLELRRAGKPLREYRIAFWMNDVEAPVAREVSDRCQHLADSLSRAGLQISDRAKPEFSSTHAHTLYRKLLGAATTFTGGELRHSEWLALEHERTKLRYMWREFFQLWDVLICPIATTAAPSHDQAPPRGRKLRIDGKEVSYFQQLFWAGLPTCAYLPSTVFPTGLSAAGLPIGLQAIGPAYGDYLTIDFAAQLAREIGGFTPPPRFAD